jgi:hypothetical protein
LLETNIWATKTRLISATINLVVIEKIQSPYLMVIEKNSISIGYDDQNKFQLPQGMGIEFFQLPNLMATKIVNHQPCND